MYRESWFDAFPNPISTVPIRSSSSDDMTIAIVAISAPTTLTV